MIRTSSDICCVFLLFLCRAVPLCSTLVKRVKSLRGSEERSRCLGQIQMVISHLIPSDYCNHVDNPHQALVSGLLLYTRTVRGARSNKSFGFPAISVYFLCHRYPRGLLVYLLCLPLFSIFEEHREEERGLSCTSEKRSDHL